MILNDYRITADGMRTTASLTGKDGIIDVNLDLIRSTIEIERADGQIIYVEPLWIEAYQNAGYAKIPGNPCHCASAQHGFPPQRQDLYFHKPGRQRGGVDLVLAIRDEFYSILLKACTIRFGTKSCAYKQINVEKAVKCLLRSMPIKEIRIVSTKESVNPFIAKRVFDREFRKTLSSDQIDLLYSAARDSSKIVVEIDDTTGQKKYLGDPYDIYKKFDNSDPCLECPPLWI